MIVYPNYRFIFTIKALGMFAKKYPDEKLVPKGLFGDNKE
jgi:lanosterol synthase